MEIKKRKKSIFDGKLLFYCCLLALPLLQYAIFYVGVNVNSFFLAFTSYDKLTGVESFAGFANFKEVFITFFQSVEAKNFGIRFINSLINYGCSLLVGTGGAVLFSYYIYKKQFLSNTFKIILFLPSVIPGIASTSIYRYFVETGLLSVYNSIAPQPLSSFLNNFDTVYGTVLFYGLFMGFGTQVMMYLGAMNNINPSITEAARLDGASFMRELWSITIPCVYPTLTTFVVVGITGIFTSDLGLYSFFATNAPGQAQTLGYYLFRETQNNTGNMARWPYISAIGLCFTAIVAPITVGLKRVLDKYDPMR